MKSSRQALAACTTGALLYEKKEVDSPFPVRQTGVAELRRSTDRFVYRIVDTLPVLRPLERESYVSSVTFC